MKTSETLKKFAEELRKLAKAKEASKFQKCAQVMLGASAIEMLKSKIKGK